MDVDEGLMESLAGEKRWELAVGGSTYVPEAVRLQKAKIPVKRPSVRGGVYFAETEAYKAECTVSDRAILGQLTGVMLGPNTDFVPLELRAAGRVVQANLAGYVESGDRTILNMIVTGVS